MRSRGFSVLAAALAVVAGAGFWAMGPGKGAERPPVEALLTDAPEVVEDAPIAEDGAGMRSEAEAETLSGARGGVTDSRSAASRTAWDLPVTRNEQVEYWIDFLKGRNHDKTHLWLEREGRYGPFIRSKLRERGMPEDLLYLVMIESGLSPKAYSRAHAAGLWQFIAETGRRYGLEVTTYVDERRDPLAATDAALSYLEDLYERFGSWYLAAAAYNSGENRVERILRQRAGGQKGDEALFWKIAGHLPRETRDYVPLMLAAGHIGKDPNAYGFRGLEHQPPLAYEEVRVPGGVTLALVAKAAGAEAAAVSDLNPHLVRGMTPPGRSWDVRVPVGTGGRVAADLDRLLEDQRLAGVEHRVGRGETLSHIARRYGVSVATLRAANGGIDPRRLQVGQRLSVPSQGERLAVSGGGEPTWMTYRVRRGDTLWGIARRHGVTIQQLRSWNGVRSRIYPGQQIRIAV